MSRSLFLIFNHQITERQQRDALQTLLVTTIRDLPQELSYLWRAIPPEMETIETDLVPIQTWLIENAKAGDYVLIQGDFGATYLMVRFAFERGLIPIYSTTERQAVEQHGPDGVVTLSHQFKHCRFRRYGE